MQILIIVLAVVVGAPIVGLSMLTGMPTQIAAFAVGATIIAIVVGLALHSDISKRKRRAALREKYGDETANRIIGGEIWQGMTAEQLLEALGKPVAVDNAATVRVKREVWKYDQVGQNRFRNRITVDNGLVTAWTARAL